MGCVTVRSSLTLIIFLRVLFTSCVVFFVAVEAENFDFNIQFDGNYCQPEKLIFYKVVFHTYWTSDRFPKHYPYSSPGAQWSRLVGQSHSKNYTLYRIGQQCSPGMKLFAETGDDRLINNNAQKTTAVYDIFSAPPILSGSGRSETQLFVDGNHSLVSLVSRMSPSPDWFVGLDSFNLCINGNWVDSVTVEVDPTDAGSDNGLTFNSADWPTKPQGIVFRISSTLPKLPASSFFYPELKQLPPIATFQFIKIKSYDLSEVFYRSEDEKNYEVFRIDNRNIREPTPANMVDLEMEEQRIELEREMLNNMKKNGSFKEEETTTHMKIPRDYMLETWTMNVLPNGGSKHKNRKRRRKIKYKDCKVSEWTEWSKCSTKCGVGDMTRTRRILVYPEGHGTPCPPLLETKGCNESHCINVID